MQKKSV